MEKLPEDRGVFHSEADFQHALAWKIREERKDLKVRLERPIQTSDGGTIAVDIWLAEDKDKIFAIELKLHKAEYTGKFKDEYFENPTNNPRDYCYGVLADVERLERLIKIKQEQVKGGAVILISNQRLDWERDDADGSGCNFENFSLHEGRKIRSNKEMDWRKGTLEGYKGKERLKPIQLNNDYTLKWEDYHDDPESAKNGKFRWLGIEVKPKP